MNADDDRDATSRGKGKAPEAERFDVRLSELRRKLDAEKRREAERQGAMRADNTGMAQALKLGSEFVAGVIVGFALGYGIDYFLGTTPWAMIVFLLLGFAAGTLNVMRAAGKVAEPDRSRLKRRNDNHNGFGKGAETGGERSDPSVPDQQDPRS